MYKLLLIFVVVFALVVPAFAQDTPQETAPAVDFVALFETIKNVALLVAVALGSGAVGYARAISQWKKEDKDNAERLYNAIPPNVAKVLRDVIVAGKATFNTLDEISDNKPNTAPTAPPTGFDSTQLQRVPVIKPTDVHG